MDPVVLSVFAFVYLGMIAGRFRGIALDRSGIVLLGAIVLIATGRMSPAEGWEAADVPTMMLLFGLMVVSAQFRMGGFYTLIARRQATVNASPRVLLAHTLAVSAVLSSVLTNDIVCLAMAPVILDICSRKGLNPVVFLVGLACSANVGSAATLIGNPQNMLIGQVLGMSFSGYLLQAVVPVGIGLILTWGILCIAYRGRWHVPVAIPEFAATPFDAWQTFKGAAVLVVLIALFLWGKLPRENLALLGAGVLMVSRRMASKRFLGLVDWNLLVLFMGLFAVNETLRASGTLDAILRTARDAGVNPDDGGWLFVLTVVLSNLVSNVPAVMLLLPSTGHADAGLILALVSTLAGNLLIVGSIANIIVVDQAAAAGVRIGWREHARVGVPVTFATLAVVAVWLAILNRVA